MSGKSAGAGRTGSSESSDDQRAAAAGQQLDNAGFSPAEYVDRLFPDDAALEGVDVAAANIGHRLQAVQQEIRRQLRAQSDGQQQQTQGIEATKAAISELYTRISEMKGKAQTSERMVSDITQDIKALDVGKRNLTQTTGTMRRLQLLVGAVDQLRQLREQGRFGEAARLLPAIAGLREGFSEYHGVRQIARLDEAAQVQQRRLGGLAQQVIQRGFDAQGRLVGDAEQMRAACGCCMADEQARVTDAYCEQQLRAYAAIFPLGDDESQLEHVSRRYAWLRRILRNYAEEHAAAFPAGWRMDEELSRRFARATRDQLGEIMATRALDVDGLTAALADTLAFEAQCDKKFGAARGADGSFVGAVSCAFEPYMAVFVDGEQRRLEALVRGFQQADEARDASLSVLASSTELLYEFRASLRRCAALSTGQAMGDLAQVFAQVLGGYARQVLAQRLPARDASLDALRQACLVANTADYCASAAAQLEQKIGEHIDAEQRARVSFAGSREALLGSINASVGALVGGVEAMCEAAFAALAAAPWHDVQAVGDQSEYVLLVASAVDASVAAVRPALSGPRYFRSFCDKLAARISDRFMRAVVQCGRVSEVGAEQLLLDAQALKSVLLGVPAIGAPDPQSQEPPAPPPAAYARVVAQGFGRVEALLKAVLVPSDPADALVGRFLLLFPDAPRDVFRQVLRLKGVKPTEHAAFIRVLQQQQGEAQGAGMQGDGAQIEKKHAGNAYATPEPRGTALATHVAGRAPASAPLASRGGRAFDSADSPTPRQGEARDGFAADPLGITAARAEAGEQSSDVDNAAGTRTRLNENLRRLMGTMRR